MIQTCCHLFKDNGTMMEFFLTGQYVQIELPVSCPYVAASLISDLLVAPLRVCCLP